MRQETSVHDMHRKLQQRGNVKDVEEMPKPKPRPARPTPRPMSRPPKPRPNKDGIVRESRRKDQRVAIAIDVQNLYYGAKDIFRTKVAYNQLMARGLDGRQLARSIAYVAHKDGNNQSGFIELLESLGCDVKCKEVIERTNSMKCNWDVEIAVDALALADKVDVFVLASGDGDFTYLLKVLKARGIRTEVISFRKITSHTLIEEADKFTDIDHSMLIDENKAWKKRDMYRRQNERREEEKSEGTEEDPPAQPQGDEEDEDYYEEPEYPE